MDEKPESKTIRLLNDDFPTKQVILENKNGTVKEVYKKFITGTIIFETWSRNIEDLNNNPMDITRMYCSECRTEIPDVLYKYCPRCGVRLKYQDLVIFHKEL